eukprot:SAG31_NODE_35636_length_321_cov_0.779279_1_plen_58_part_10
MRYAAAQRALTSSVAAESAGSEARADRVDPIPRGVLNLVLTGTEVRILKISSADAER